MRAILLELITPQTIAEFALISWIVVLVPLSAAAMFGAPR